MNRERKNVYLTKEAYAFLKSAPNSLTINQQKKHVYVNRQGYESRIAREKANETKRQADIVADRERIALEKEEEKARQ